MNKNSISKHKGFFSFDLFCLTENIRDINTDDSNMFVRQLHNFLHYIQLQEHPTCSTNMEY